MINHKISRKTSFLSKEYQEKIFAGFFRSSLKFFWAEKIFLLNYLEKKTPQCLDGEKYSISLGAERIQQSEKRTQI